eukprot:768335-Hanusia_phi.AAC.3
MQSIAESIDASLLDSAREWVDPSRQLEVQILLLLCSSLIALFPPSRLPSHPQTSFQVAGSLSYASQHGG